MKKKYILLGLIFISVLSIIFAGKYILSNESNALQNIFKIKVVDKKGNVIPNASVDVYGKPTMEESNTVAIFDTGNNVRNKIFDLSNEPVEGYYECGDNGDEYCGDIETSLVKKIMVADLLPNDFVASEENTISSTNSEQPIYIWYDKDNKILYYYTEGETIYLNEYSDFMFYSFDELETIDGMKNWNTSNVTNMGNMFSGTHIRDLTSLSDWNTSSVTYMGSMFSNTQISDITPLSNWNTSNVTDMSWMFSGNTELVDLTPLANWDTSNVTDMSYMFIGSNSIDVATLSGLDTSNVTNMRGMFRGCDNLQNIDGLSDWDTSKVTNMYWMFSLCTNLVNIDGTLNWDTSSVTDMGGMFESCTNLQNINGAKNWDTSSVTNMTTMFFRCNSLESIDGLSNWNTSNVKSMKNMFSYTHISDLTSLSNWDTSNVEVMRGMFEKCSKVTGTFTINGNPTDYFSVFNNAATEPGSKLIVNYSKNTTNIDQIIATKSPNSNIVKGVQID